VARGIEIIFPPSLSVKQILDREITLTL